MFKEGDRVVVKGWINDKDGPGTIAMWDQRVHRDGRYYVRLDNYEFYNESTTGTDSHIVPERCVRKLTKLDKALA